MELTNTSKAIIIAIVGGIAFTVLISFVGWLLKTIFCIVLVGYAAFWYHQSKNPGR